MSRMITVNDFSKEQYDIILIGSADELKKKSNIGDLLLLHGNAYEIKKIGRSDKTYEFCALLININNPKDRAIRSLNYLAKELPHLIKKKNKIVESIENKILYIIRGIPGSGKSTLANKLTSNVVEADQFMYEDGEYKWKPEKLHMAHQKCKETVEQYMQEGRDKIAVANTFIKLKEIKPYIDLAKQYDYKIVVKECDGGFQSVHNVPEETLEKMKSKFQPYKDEEMNESKQLTESILYDDLAYNDWNEKYEQLTVIANPSIEWLRNQLNSDDCWGFRFLHNTERNKLYVWDCKQPWMHQQVFDMVDMDWGKPGTNVVGIFEPDCVAVWEELAEDGEAESSIRLAKKLDGKLFKELYPDGYEMTTCC